MADFTKTFIELGITIQWNFIGIIPADIELPKLSISTEVIYLWNFTKKSDIEQFNEFYFSRDSLNFADYLWFNSLSHGIGPYDVSLISNISLNKPFSIQEIISMLESHLLFNMTDTTIRLCENFLRTSKSPGVLSPPFIGDFGVLWREGFLTVDNFGFPSLHPCAIVKLKRFDLLSKILVAGQLNIFMPLLIKVHALIHSTLNKELGDD